MTFSDSRIVDALKKDWNPVWESVSPVREVTFDLGEGRNVTGTVGGEIAIYFCDDQGNVFDILPALQSPAATLKAMESAVAFYQKHDGKIRADAVAKHHRTRLRSTLEEIFKTHPERFTSPNEKGQLLPLDTENSKIESVEAQQAFPGTAANEAYRQKAINTALDQATYDMRLMVLSKVAMSTPSEGKITVVEPGGRGYYHWQVDQAFCGIVPDWASLINRVEYPKEEWPWVNFAPRQTVGEVEVLPNRAQIHPLSNIAWNTDLKQPKAWQRLLFEGILHQPIGGGKFKYDSESLEALSIIE